MVQLLCSKHKGHDKATLGAPGSLGRPALVKAAAEGHAEVVELVPPAVLVDRRRPAGALAIQHHDEQ